MGEFKNGDRVRVVSVTAKDKKYYEVGFTGTIVDTDEPFLLVEFDQETDYIKKIPCLKGVSWACGVEEVEIIEEVKA